MDQYLFGLLADCVVLTYLVKKIRSRRRFEALSHLSFLPHVTAQGEFMCFAMARRKHSAD